jgi:hypothetical protein
MPEEWLGVEVEREKVTWVRAKIPDDADAPIEILGDETLLLQQGARAQAYPVIHATLSGLAEGMDLVVVKASEGGRHAATQGRLEAAELRGVAICALAGKTSTTSIKKASISRTFGERKTDEYIDDDRFWEESVTGRKMRKGSRLAAMVIIAERKGRNEKKRKTS